MDTTFRPDDRRRLESWVDEVATDEDRLPELVLFGLMRALGAIDGLRHALVEVATGKVADPISYAREVLRRHPETRLSKVDQPAADAMEDH